MLFSIKFRVKFFTSFYVFIRCKIKSDFFESEGGICWDFEQPVRHVDQTLWTSEIGKVVEVVLQFQCQTLFGSSLISNKAIPKSIIGSKTIKQSQSPLLAQSNKAIRK